MIVQKKLRPRAFLYGSQRHLRCVRWSECLASIWGKEGGHALRGLGVSSGPETLEAYNLGVLCLAGSTRRSLIALKNRLKMRRQWGYDRPCQVRKYHVGRDARGGLGI